MAQTSPWGARLLRGAIPCFARVGRSWTADGLDDFERLLATMRLVLALSLTVLSFGTAPALSAPLMGTLCAYAAYAAVVRARLALGTESTLVSQMVTLATDLLTGFALHVFWPTFGIAGSVLFLYGFLSTSARWGGPACVVVALWGVVGEFARTGFGTWPSGGSLDGGWSLPRLLSLSAIATSFCYVGYAVYERCSDAVAVARLKDAARVEGGFSRSLHAVLVELTALFGAQSARVLAHDLRTNREFLWALDSPFTTDSSVHCSEVTGAGASDDEQQGHTWTAPFLIGEWTGRLILVRPDMRRVNRHRARLFARMVDSVVPVLYDIHRAARVRSRAIAHERAKISRQIHDGTIQALLGTEMLLEALSNQCQQDGVNPITTELTRVRMLLHREVLNLRDLMLHLRPLDVTARQLRGFLEELVERFARDTGIDANFRGCDISRFDLSRHTCNEIVRIVQEALTNVRKHSRARRVIVRLSWTAQGLHLVVEDDGVGFVFEGTAHLVASDMTYSHAERMPPPNTDTGATTGDYSRPLTLATIRESVRAIDGSLVVSSERNGGARLEITIPANVVADSRNAKMAM
jgi:signal transduction histidine kinase